jgi:sulfur-carrier protein adenylyltransferase/sulfurtransferase
MQGRHPARSLPADGEIDPAQALEFIEMGALLLDVRDANERAAGTARPSIAMAPDRFAEDLAAIGATPARALITICASGRRSLHALEVLRELGYRNVASVRGGYRRWHGEGLPVEYGALDTDSAERYARHLVLPEVGIAGQARLAAARVALVGAGGLGSPAALYLAAAGVGSLTLIDDDRVERSNLQRQILHVDARVGMAKTESARIALCALNPAIRVETREQRVGAGNVEALLSGHDVVVDGADNFPTRYLLDAACRRLRIPMVYGAVHRFSGQISVFDPRREDSPCYRCLFAEPPSAAEAPNCSEAGVLGVLPGIIGLLQASEVIKLILQVGRPLVGRLLCFDALAARFQELALPRDPACPGCSSSASFSGYQEIARVCAS